MARSPAKGSSRTVVFAIAGVNLAVCAVLAAVLLMTHREQDSGGWPALDAAPPSTTEYVSPVDPPSTTWSTVSTTDTPVSAAPPGFSTVTGPGGLTTAIPTGWPSVRASGPGAMQADDPAGTLRFLRYGGSPAPAEDIYTVHADYQRTFSGTRPGFQSLRLERTELRGFEAVDWEFELDAPEGRRHVHSLYWRAQGYEYFVYASAPTARWPETQHILDVMIDTASP